MDQNYTFFHVLGHSPTPKRACGCTNTQNHQHYDPEMIRKLLKGLLRSKKSSIPISNYSTSHEFSEENVPTTQKIFVRNVVEDLGVHQNSSVINILQSNII